MNEYHIHLVGSSQPLRVCVDRAIIQDLEVGGRPNQFISCTLSDADEHGVLRRAVIAVGRIQCIIEAGE